MDINSILKILNVQDNDNKKKPEKKSESNNDTVKTESPLKSLDNFKPKTSLKPKSDKININYLLSIGNSTNNNNRFSNNTNLTKVLNGKLVLSSGSKGEDVKLVQNALKDMGFYSGSKVDGKFGNLTATSIKNFQDNQGLKKTGTLNKETMTSLNKLAPKPGEKIWDKEYLSNMTNDKLIPSNIIDKKNDLKAKIVVDLSEHRLFLFDDKGEVNKVYSIATGAKFSKEGNLSTTSGIRIIDGKNNDPSEIGQKLWDTPKAFGVRLINLSKYDVETGKKSRIGHELHGTYNKNSIGKDASYGCMRMLNEDVLEVYDLIDNGQLVKIND